MTGKEIIFSALRHETTKRAPWVPFAGVHAGFLTGADATEVLCDEEKLVQSLLEVNRLYKPDGQPVVFDLQLEAEILGCELRWAKDGPPSVASHPLEDTMTVPCDCTLPTPESGRMPLVLSAMRRMKQAVGDTTALYGLFCGPFTLASHLRGNDLFMDMYDDEEYVEQLMEFCVKCGKAMTDMFADAGMDVIAIVDPLVSQISSDHFETFLSKPYTELFEYIKQKGLFSSFFVCGNATRNIDVMCQTKPDSISVDENVDIFAAKEICDKYNVAIGGNIPLTSVMLHGTQQDNMKYVVDMLSKIGEYKNIIVAPGCDMPYAIPIENVIGATQAVLQTDDVAKIIENYTSETFDIEVELPDYQNLEKPLIEAFTLDSLTCAACTYMWGAATTAKQTYGDKIDIVEYKFTEKENIARCQKMGVSNLPSIYVNGELKFSSIIPSKQELESVIDEALAKLAQTK